MMVVASKRASITRGQLFNQLRQWRQLSFVNQIEFLHKEYKVFEASVEMGLLAQLHHLAEVLVVDVGVHPEQTLQDGFHY